MRRRMFSAVPVVLLLLAATDVRAQRVSYFRHDGGLADSDTKPLPAEVDPGRNLLWCQPLPPGNSTPCVVGDRIFVTGTLGVLEIAAAALKIARQ